MQSPQNSPPSDPGFRGSSGRMGDPSSLLQYPPKQTGSEGTELLPPQSEDSVSCLRSVLKSLRGVSVSPTLGSPRCAPGSPPFLQPPARGTREALLASSCLWLGEWGKGGCPGRKEQSLCLRCALRPSCCHRLPLLAVGRFPAQSAALTSLARAAAAASGSHLAPSFLSARKMVVCVGRPPIPASGNPATLAPQH